MSRMPDWISKWLPRWDSKNKVPCALCGKKIEDTAFVMVRGAIIIDDKALKNPTIFTCMEQAFNYAQGYYAHTDCWMEHLKQLGIPLYDMDKVYDEYNKRHKESMKTKPTRR